MTLDEAKKVAAICSTADGGCSTCIKSLCVQLQTEFALFCWTFEEGEDGPAIRVEKREFWYLASRRPDGKWTVLDPYGAPQFTIPMSQEDAFEAAARMNRALKKNLGFPSD